METTLRSNRPTESIHAQMFYNGEEERVGPKRVTVCREYRDHDMETVAKLSQRHGDAKDLEFWGRAMVIVTNEGRKIDLFDSAEISKINLTGVPLFIEHSYPDGKKIPSPEETDKHLYKQPGPNSIPIGKIIACDGSVANGELWIKGAIDPNGMSQQQLDLLRNSLRDGTLGGLSVAYGYSKSKSVMDETMCHHGGGVPAVGSDGSYIKFVEVSLCRLPDISGSDIVFVKATKEDIVMESPNSATTAVVPAAAAAAITSPVSSSSITATATPAAAVVPAAVTSAAATTAAMAPAAAAPSHPSTTSMTTSDMVPLPDLPRTSNIVGLQQQSPIGNNNNTNATISHPPATTTNNTITAANSSTGPMQSHQQLVPTSSQKDVPMTDLHQQQQQQQQSVPMQQSSPASMQQQQQPLSGSSSNIAIQQQQQQQQQQQHQPSTIPVQQNKPELVQQNKSEPVPMEVDKPTTTTTKENPGGRTYVRLDEFNALKMQFEALQRQAQLDTQQKQALLQAQDNERFANEKVMKAWPGIPFQDAINMVNNSDRKTLEMVVDKQIEMMKNVVSSSQPNPVLTPTTAKPMEVSPSQPPAAATAAAAAAPSPFHPPHDANNVGNNQRQQQQQQQPPPRNLDGVWIPLEQKDISQQTNIDPLSMPTANTRKAFQQEVSRRLDELAPLYPGSPLADPTQKYYRDKIMNANPSASYIDYPQYAGIQALPQ